jgi:hypothetical protein
MTHLARIKELALSLREIIPICYIKTIQHMLDEIIAEATAAEKEMK